MVKIQRISKNGLSKQEWNFDCKGTCLTYVSHFVYNRNNKREKWADEKPNTLSFEDWCKYNNKSDDDDYNSDDLYYQYQKYRDKLNLILQKTKTGKSKLSGISARIKNMPKCPQDVAKEAKKVFCEQLKVVYE